MNVKAVLESLGVQPSKRKGQNFLYDPSIALQLVHFAKLQPGEAVLEVGPGLGTLTKALLSVGTNLSVAEIEPAFCDYLEREFEELTPERVLRGDARKLDLAEFAKAQGQESVSVVSNVPYSFSSDIVLWILQAHSHVRSASLLLQEEFANRLCAGPGSRTYGAISVQRTVFAEAVLGPQVPGSCFHPIANVSSRVLRLEMRAEPLVPTEHQTAFRDVVRAAFNQRRKTLLNALSSGLPSIEKPRWNELLLNSEVDPKRRAETLSVEEFLRLTNAMLAEG